MKARLFCVFIALCVVGHVQSQIVCKWTDPATKNEYDLTPLMNNQNDYIFGYDPTDPVKKVYMNVCRAVITNLCGAGVAACQQWDPKNTGGQASLGQASTLTFTYGPQKSNNGANGLIAHWTKGDPVNTADRKLEVDFVCKKDAGVGIPAFWNEDDLIYYFTWSSQHGCPTNGGGGGGAGGKGGLSGGSIFLIILLVCAVVYLVGGVLFRKFKVHAEGVDVIPNLNFWTSLPGLTKDGFVWVFRKITGKGGSGAAYTTVR